MNRVLVVAAHPDDEALGCAGTIALHSRKGDEVHILFVADGETARQNNHVDIEKRQLRSIEAAEVLGAESPIFLPYNDQRLDSYPILEITQRIEQVARDIEPTIVYTHHHGDMNRDHRIVNEAVMTAFRPAPFQSVREIYGFEVASSTEWASGTQEAFKPSRFCDISFSWEKKVSALKCYHLEMRDFPHPRSYEGLEVLAKLRGVQSGMKLAEAFTVLRILD